MRSTAALGLSHWSRPAASCARCRPESPWLAERRGWAGAVFTSVPGRPKQQILPTRARHSIAPSVRQCSHARPRLVAELPGSHSSRRACLQRRSGRPRRSLAQLAIAAPLASPYPASPRAFFPSLASPYPAPHRPPPHPPPPPLSASSVAPSSDPRARKHTPSPPLLCISSHPFCPGIPAAGGVEIVLPSPSIPKSSDDLD
jgi:hypothetical protein